MYLSNICIEVYELDLELDLELNVSVPGLARQAALKKTKVKLDLLADIDMMLMVEKGSRGGICHPIHRDVKANIKYIKDYNNTKESYYRKY